MVAALAYGIAAQWFGCLLSTQRWTDNWIMVRARAPAVGPTDGHAYLRAHARNTGGDLRCGGTAGDARGV